MLSSLSSTIITVFDVADLPSSAAPFRPTAGLAVISFGSVRASHIKKGCGLLGPDASAYGGKRIGGSAQHAPRTGNARDCKRKDTGASRESFSHCAAGR